MKRVFITDFDKNIYNLKELFPLARPFWEVRTDNLLSNGENTQKSKFTDLEIEMASSTEEADFILISEPLDHLHDKNKYARLANINELCLKNNTLAYAVIRGDYGKVHPQFSNIIYFRMGGFKKQLDENNKAFYFQLSDQLNKLFSRDDIILRPKEELPTVGFCGHASNSILKFFYEKFKLARVNMQRISKGDFNFEPLFSSAYERSNILKSIGRSKDIKTNFIFRKKYRAGAVTVQERQRTTLEYYENILASDYVVCLRGSGNFSVRLYETLMMGRIPVFINTDCLLPLEDEIDWKNHVVWVEWENRKDIAEIIIDFHNRITKENFIQMQRNNRELWESRLTVKNYLNNILGSL